MSSVPKCLADYRDAIRAVSELETIRQSLVDKSKELNLGFEIKFLTDEIDELNRQLDTLEKKTSKIFKLLQKYDSRAHLYASLYFRCGYLWDEVTDMLNKESVESVKATVYRALNKLREQGYSID